MRRLFLCALLSLGLVLGLTSPASAWGSYVVTRPGCGTNGIESNAINGLAHASTWNITCNQGPLGAATRYSNGSNSGIAWGYTRVWSLYNPAWGAVGGAHWGCYTCSQSNS